VVADRRDLLGEPGVGRHEHVRHLHEVVEPAAAHRIGSLYNFVKVTDMLVPPDTWFTQEVTAIGNHIVIKVNGKTTVDYVDEKNTHMKGHFAFQQHNLGSEVWIRNVRVKELPAK
jgi:hypothetical protein